VWKIRLLVIRESANSLSLSLSPFSSHLSAEEKEKKEKNVANLCFSLSSKQIYKYITLHRGLFYQVQIETF